LGPDFLLGKAADFFFENKAMIGHDVSSSLMVLFAWITWVFYTNVCVRKEVLPLAKPTQHQRKLAAVSATIAIQNQKDAMIPKMCGINLRYNRADLTSLWRMPVLMMLSEWALRHTKSSTPQYLDTHLDSPRMQVGIIADVSH